MKTVCSLKNISKTIVKAESLSLVGAEIFRVPVLRRSGGSILRDKHILPHPIKYANPQRYASDGKFLYSPDWTRSPTYNSDFIDAVVVAVSAVEVSLSMQYSFDFIADCKLQADATIGCAVPTVKKAVKTYFRQMVKNYESQNLAVSGYEKENLKAAKQLDALHEMKFQVFGCL